RHRGARPLPHQPAGRIYVRTTWYPATGALRAAAARSDQRVFLCDPVAGAGSDLRPAQHHQLHARRAVYAGCLRCLDAADLSWHRLLVGAPHRAGRRWHHRHHHRAAADLAALPPRPSLRAAAYLRPRADHPGRAAQPVRHLRPALCDPAPAFRRTEPRLHVPAELSRLGRGGLARRLPRDLVRDREDAAWRLPARRHREPDAGWRLRHQRAAHDHADLRLWRRARGLRGGARRSDLLGEPQHGRRPLHRRVRRRRDRRHGLDPRRDRDRLRPRADRGPDEGLLSGGIVSGDLRHHGGGPARQTRRPVREDCLMTAVIEAQSGTAAQQARAGMPAHRAAIFIGLLAAGLVAPFLLYPVFVMKVLCFALFACAFNLLLGYGGLLSFGHAAYFGGAAYVSAHAAKVWGFPPELAILSGVVGSAILGRVFGALAIRRQGIYFAMVTLAFAQMVFFFSLQAPFTGGEDGLQAVPRGNLFGVLSLRSDFSLYFVVLAIFLGGLLLIYRII